MTPGLYEFSGATSVLDLFDIRVVEMASPAQLKEYPIAMPDRTVIVGTNRGNDLVLEANSEDDANCFVHGMRWIVARLAFNLIIGNMEVSCELLDVSRQKNDRPKNPLEEVRWSRAMNDVANSLVEKSI